MVKKNLLEQLSFFIQDYKRQTGSKKLRMFYLWLSRASVGIMLYRIERMMFLWFGNVWKVIRVLFLPILFPLYAYSNLEISYTADIGPGISVLHPSMGVVISGFATIGKNLTLTGGNVIGGKLEVRNGGGKFMIGDNVNLGANAVILGPVVLGDKITIGALAMVNKDFESDCTLVGVPANNIMNKGNRCQK